MRILLRIVAVAAAATTALIPGAAARLESAHHPGFPVLACDDPRYPYANHYGRLFRPSGFCGTRRGNGAEGIDHTRWRNWGSRQATGRGSLVVYDGGLGEFPAEISAENLYTTANFTGGHDYMSAYLSLHVHVLARRSPATAGVMVWRGPLNLTLDVQIQE